MVMRAALLAAAVTVAQADHFAVLVAGSNTYGNYRHQADVCHAFQVVKEKGVPEENIILMAYDDIANDDENPFPGKLFNKPTKAGVAGKDVYAGCNIDYKGKDVTPTNFVNVLTGKGSGKVLKSTSEDNVFVYFADHGAPGLIAFPEDVMHQKELQKTLNTMHEQKMYKKLVFYLETCESGSMFPDLKKIPNVYALSAASPTESSWGTYCGDDAKVDGKNIGSCLGDLFSVNWMEDSDSVDITAESLETQFNTVKTKTAKSAVMQWGDTTFTTDKVSDFQGNTDETATTKPGAGGISWSARQIDLRQASERYYTATSSKERIAAGKKLQAVLTQQLEVEATYERFLEIVYPGDEARKEAARTANHSPNNMECELSTRASFVSNGRFDSSTGFAMGFHKYVVNTCHDMVKSGANIDLAEAARQACAGATIV